MGEEPTLPLVAAIVTAAVATAAVGCRVGLRAEASQWGSLQHALCLLRPGLLLHMTHPRAGILPLQVGSFCLHACWLLLIMRCLTTHVVLMSCMITSAVKPFFIGGECCNILVAHEHANCLWITSAQSMEPQELRKPGS